jgi:putative phage-type endonuclease
MHFLEEELDSVASNVSYKILHIEEDLESVGSLKSSSTTMDQEVHSIPEDVLDEIEENIMVEMEDYIKTNIESYSSPDFQESMVIYISDSIYHATVNANLCEDTEANKFEVLMMTKEVVDHMFFETGVLKPRSYPATIDPHDMSNEDLTEIVDQIQRLKSVPQPPQRTQEWYDLRNNLITASNIYKALGSESQQNSLIYEKCRSVSNTSTGSGQEEPVYGARGWGQKYEPITAMIYEAMYPGNRLETTFGCIKHQEYNFIGASPDGIVTRGPRMGHLVEIKNTVSREISDIPIESHWVQCQVQMEVCDLPYCDYIQTSTKEITFEEFQQETVAEYKGVFLLLQHNQGGFQPINEFNVPGPSSSKYVYMPFYLLDNADPTNYESVIHSWIYDVLQESKDYFIVDIYYWKLEEMSCVIIPRNREWFQAVLLRFRDIWAKVEEARRTGNYERYAPKRRTQGPSSALLRSYQVSLLPGEQDDSQDRAEPTDQETST